MAPRRTRLSITWSARALTIAIATLTLVVACSSNDGTPCYAGDWRYCDCPSGARGYTQCDAHGTGYGACDCSGKVPAGAGVLVEAGVAEAAPTGDAALAPFLAGCTNDSDCASHLCFPFNAFGSHCSHACMKDTDCEAPSPGCSNKGVCKLH